MDRLRHYLNAWQFWILLAYVYGVAVAGYAIHLAGAISMEKEARSATIDANYEACLRSIPELRKVNAFVTGVQVLGRVVILNAEDMHKLSEPGTDVYRQQTANLARLRRAGKAIDAVHFPGPTKAQCEARRDAARAR